MREPKLSAYAFCHGEPGSMYALPARLNRHQSRSALAVSSGDGMGHPEIVAASRTTAINRRVLELVLAARVLPDIVDDRGSSGFQDYLPAATCPMCVPRRGRRGCHRARHRLDSRQAQTPAARRVVCGG